MGFRPLSYLDTFNKHEFRAVLLKNKVKLSTEPASLLGPDTGGFTVDPHNKEKVAQDILATKVWPLADCRIKEC